ncbi:cystathionine beta-lyase/cystathionine gamma-synthase [Lewinella aquimaris]|uniref:Cystathionine beta-lyase/cystathionine gamma-synthase n=1 Tax=Neolewinella aquimaris TaxID=1835722 RepID=A0A840E3U5_9BACT|nr:cystathionine gamma-synthase [Neolewinella aquimaris]MBB4079861.1 cystathionine beta-lyase/cystathionine gamma-synthase [Neolewinella aquimaris]
MKADQHANFATQCIHGGLEPDPQTGAVMTPIYQTSTYAQSAPGVHKGYEYARTGNPTRAALQNNLAAIERGEHGICFSSGLSAMDAIIRLFQPGDEILASDDLYGGSYRLLTAVLGTFGIKSRFVDMRDADALAKQIKPETKLLWIETPTNPMLNIVDIEALTTLAKERNILTCVDNTFASPYLQQPLELGADLVLHSATKYLGGHSDVVMGAVVTRDEDLAKRLYYLQNAVGAVPGPQDCFLVLRGIKTLHLRVQRACENARRIVEVLQNNDLVANVYYPGLADHPRHEVAARQMRDFGGMVSFDLKEDTMEAATQVMKNTKYFTLAESLGGVESLIGHPASMTHASIPREQRLSVGLTDSLIRLSVGVEDADDLVKDLETALAAAVGVAG